MTASAPRRSRSRGKRPIYTAQVAPPPEQVPRTRPGAPGGRRDENRREKVQRLCDAALRLFLQHGIELTRVEDMPAVAGVAKGSFYRYFTDKQQLTEVLFLPLFTAIEEALARCGTSIDDARGETLLSAAYASLGLELGQLVVAHAPVIRLYLQERRGPATGARVPVARLASFIEARAEDLSTRARAHGLLRAFPPRVSSLAVVGATEQLLHAFLSGRDLGDAAQLPALITSLVMNGLRPPSTNPAAASVTDPTSSIPPSA
jgi:AcrR family transcriptional regulator